ncbi:hypothetical protein EVG20_g10705 [Dentipellis fragilis]|uniref:Uncharacterized protein n=1 Tax=Dentipellis fragilis TaxID=205917 RepID=A0A4Y9XSE4_9AGAM|nr:hypothetical protein EVG20_g10705 [Dentipellis fragilis]
MNELLIGIVVAAINPANVSGTAKRPLLAPHTAPPTTTMEVDMHSPSFRTLRTDNTLKRSRSPDTPTPADRPSKRISLYVHGDTCMPRVLAYAVRQPARGDLCRGLEHRARGALGRADPQPQHRGWSPICTTIPRLR